VLLLSINNIVSTFIINNTNSIKYSKYSTKSFQNSSPANLKSDLYNLHINLLIRHIDSKMNKRKINNNSGARTVQQRYNIGYTVET